MAADLTRQKEQGSAQPVLLEEGFSWAYGIVVSILLVLRALARMGSVCSSRVPRFLVVCLLATGVR